MPKFIASPQWTTLPVKGHTLHIWTTPSGDKLGVMALGIAYFQVFRLQGDNWEPIRGYEFATLKREMPTEQNK
jgi:hypothetical protein